MQKKWRKEKNAMKGCFSMARLSYEEQADVVVNLLQEEINRLKSLPKEEAKLEARKGLMQVGIVDESGKYTAPYAALSGWDVR